MRTRWARARGRATLATMSHDRVDLTLGTAALAARAGLFGARVVLFPARAATRVPVLDAVLAQWTDAIKMNGAITRARARDMVLESDELDRLLCALLEHERTERLMERVLQTPGLERLVVQVLESRLADELTERLLAGPELQRVVEYVATSPQVLEAVHSQTRSLADEMAGNMRRRAESADDAAEHAVRGWLRRPRPQTAT